MPGSPDGIDFSAANFTREIVLENGEAIIGQSADTITFEDDDGTDYATLTGSLLTVTADTTVTGNDLSLGAAGVKLTGDGDGAITLLGLGDGFDEDLNINLDDTENKIVLFFFNIGR